MKEYLTVKVGKELAANMKKFPEVNWSEVVRMCIKEYIKQRQREKSTEV